MSTPSFDRVVRMGGSVIQHGRANNRIYLMQLDPAETETLLPRLDRLAARAGYTKIFAKAPVSVRRAFLRAGYREEARVPRFFHGKLTCMFLAKYFDPARARDPHAARRARNLMPFRRARRPPGPARPAPLPAAFTCRLAEPADAPALADLYRAVFETYPFPIHDPAFLRQTMHDHVVYACVHRQDELVAVASAEMALSAGTVEMTDFATAPAARGRGLSRFLLRGLEADMAGRGLRTAYTIARAASAPMNRTFAAAGYRYGGTLIRNTQICGSLESMNIWYKPLYQPRKNRNNT